uniref:cysteine-rich receptor-like protein kinase 45 n=1 Tax=Erigeron canadensis TaxID=72917 RepID=UPI001CB944BD|nr:cysteine-rich receptor-like protein kinase 45 [Erigeron canadensis]
MSRDKVKNRAEITIVVLDGTNVLREKSGVEPLRYALNKVMKPDDEVVVLVIFSTSDMIYSSPVVTSCCISKDGRDHHQQPSERERYIRILREEISQGTEHYMKVFRPFYKECKSKRVKFMVKIVVGSTLDAIVTEERYNIGASLVVIGRNFAKENAPWVTRKNNKLLHMDDVKVLTYTCMPQNDVISGSSSVQETVYITQSISRFKRKTVSHDEKLVYCTLPNFEGIYQPSTSSSSIETNYHESSQEFEGYEIVEETTIATSSSTNYELGFFDELSWEVITEITEQFSNIIPIDSFEAFQMYRGFFQDQRSAVFVKRYAGINYGYVLEAEKKAASTMYHKNILGLLAFHKNEAALALVFPDVSRGAFMDRFLNGFWTRELKISFQVKMNIAIGIAQGLRYMHEQCPRGAVVHGDLRPCNILLGNNLEPQITGFGKAKWLQLDQSSPTRNSCGHKHPSDMKSLNLIKSDILAFGILLLRLFCNRSAPRDDKYFVRWARPLLAQRAYHVLYDELEYDVHGLCVVTSAAARCVSTNMKSRPCMSKVLSYLKGEVSCAEQTFPSTESSPNTASPPDPSIWEI